MKLLIIGDAMIPYELAKKEFVKVLGYLDVEISGFDWDTGGIPELSRLNRIIEKRGPGAVNPPKKLLEQLEETDILIVQYCPLPKWVLERGKKLKLIGVMRAGVENVDLKSAEELGITVLNVHGRNAQAAAEHALGLLISEVRNIARSYYYLKKGEWRRDYVNTKCCPNLHKKIFGIIGFGKVGHKFITLLSGFEPQKILIFDPNASEKEIADFGAEKVELEELCRKSDFISIHARLNEKNRYMISEKEFSMMKSTAFVINTARAGLVDEKALVRTLKNKKILGAALDVFEDEPIPKGSPLLGLDNITLTPHLAGSTIDSFRYSAELLAGDILQLIIGKQAKFTLTPKITTKKGGLNSIELKK